MTRRTLQTAATLALVVLMAGCATGRAFSRGRAAADKGDWDTAVAYYRDALAQDPSRVDVKIALQHAMQEASAAHLKRAHDLEAQQQLAGAAAEYRLAADIDPSNVVAESKAQQLDKQIREQVEASQPKSHIEELREQVNQMPVVPQLSPTAHVNLHFQGAAVKDVLGVIAAQTGVNITYDNAQPMDQYLGRPFTIDLQDTTLEDALNQVLSANQLFYEVVDAKTILVAPDTMPNRQRLEPQAYQTFFVSNADITELGQMLTQVIQTMTGLAVRPVITTNKIANTISVKASVPVLQVIGKLIEANDFPHAQVAVEVQILEVDRTRIKQYGINLSNYSLGFTFSPEAAPPNTAANLQAAPTSPPPFNLNTISNGINTADFYLSVPTALVNLLESDSSTKILADPTLIGIEGSALTLNLGDQIPVLNTTFGSVATGGVATVPQTSYTYQPVGVNLSITPRVTFDGEIVLDPVTVEKSALGADVLVAGQSIPSITDRKVTTRMRLRDGESDLLAGLISQQDRHTLQGPAGIMSLPVLRSLFGGTNNEIDSTDIVVVITPHVLRSHELTTTQLAPVYLGTQQNFGLTGPPPLIAPNGGGGGTTPAPAPAPPASAPAAPQPPAAPAGAQIAVVPPGAELPRDAPSNVPIVVTNVSDLGSISVTVTYNPAVLQAVSVSPGTLMQQGGIAPAFTPRIDQTAGRVDIVLTRGPAPGATAAQTQDLLASVVFQPLAAGTSPISIAGVAMTSAGKPIAVSFVSSSVTVK